MNKEVYPRMIKDLPGADIPFEGVKGWLLQGVDHQLVFLDIEIIGQIPEHSQYYSQPSAARASCSSSG
jgi:hypothetical protein